MYSSVNGWLHLAVLNVQGYDGERGRETKDRASAMVKDLYRSYILALSLFFFLNKNVEVGGVNAMFLVLTI